MKRFQEMSYAVALASPGVGGRRHDNFRIGAVLICDSRIYSAFNSYKTSPRLSRYYRFPCYHAEAGCILKAGLLNCRKGSLYITRIKRDGSLALAKPCPECQVLIKAAKIKHVIYSTENGYDTL